MFQTKEQVKPPEADLKEMKISGFSEKFKIMVKKMLTEVMNIVHDRVRISTKRKKI